jgi:hypothetical protein
VGLGSVEAVEKVYLCARARLYRIDLPIPEFLSNGLLPAGLHDCSLQDVADRFSFTPDRRLLFEKFRQAISFLPSHEAIDCILVDGSFAEDRPAPRDIDAVLVVGDLLDGGPGGLLLAWVATRHRQLKATYSADLYVDDSAGVAEHWRGFWGQTRDGRPKGILRVVSGWGGVA